MVRDLSAVARPQRDHECQTAHVRFGFADRVASVAFGERILCFPGLVVGCAQQHGDSDIERLDTTRFDQLVDRLVCLAGREQK